jgi:RND family efflux transporter MFP subunit
MRQQQGSIGQMWNGPCIARCAGITAVLAWAQMPQAWAQSFECLIEPNQIVEIRSPVEGLIDKIHVKRGDKVVAGQILVQLESNAEQSAAEMARYRSQMAGRIATAKNRLEYATKKANRSEDLHKQNFVSAQARDEAEAERQIAESELKDAIENQELAKHDLKHNLDLMNRRMLRSPFTGVVVDRMLNPGDLAEAGTGRKAILKLAEIEPLRVEVVLPITAHGKLRVGSRAEVMPEGLGGRHSARVTVVDSVLDSASATFGVRLELPNPKGSLPSGIRCRVEFPELKSGGGGSMRPQTAR